VSPIEFRRAVRRTFCLTALIVAVSVVVTSLIQYLAGQEIGVVHFMLAVGMPLLLAPLTLWPLIRANVELRAIRRTLEEQARTDHLSGLPNRRAFFERAGEVFARADRSGEPVTAMMVDIDRFKAINDAYGHEAGDRVLRAVGRALQDAVLGLSQASEAIFARIGGEEFAVLIAGVGPDAVMGLAESLCQQARDLVCLADGTRMAVTVSIGIAMRNPGEDIDATLRAADKAVYAAKRAGRDGWRVSARQAAGRVRAA
jgi:diguanylate cyclase (GGDEF)-like protein